MCRVGVTCGSLKRLFWDFQKGGERSRWEADFKEFRGLDVSGLLW